MTWEPENDTPTSITIEELVELADLLGVTPARLADALREAKPPFLVTADGDRSQAMPGNNGGVS